MIIVISLLLIFTGCTGNEINDSYSWTENKFIAHAAGDIDGVVYTNSLEAFRKSYEEGYRLFEIDISITSDGELVARHGWEENYGQDNFVTNKPLSYEKFMSLPYYDKYTAMDFKMIIKLLEEFKDIYLILDGKVTSVEDTKVIYKEVGEATRDMAKSDFNRLIPQLFYEDNLSVIRQYGFHDLIYVIGREEYTNSSIIQFCEDNDIRVVSLSRKRANERFIQKLAVKDINVYIYTLNDVDEMKSYKEIGVHGYFTDLVKPDTF
ncbi:glycerophosphodiester phosphodiesterase family protein [Aquibacillus saliphilus]|uniref:glycerophosphodiester phosphodiesterase family protein n=1 Tax=Aquibacillus saliphilus TaxID=1909422 RepID=UPI001CF06816|nr:glycerophosphodiester phosphodiesterase family protein [Aquibacillus saliphilus]